MGHLIVAWAEALDLG